MEKQPLNKRWSLNLNLGCCLQRREISTAAPAEPRGEKKLFLMQILGGEKLLKFVEKCR